MAVTNFIVIVQTCCMARIQSLTQRAVDDNDERAEV